MRVIVAVLLMVVFITPYLISVEAVPIPPEDHTKRNIESLRWCLGALVAQLMVLVEVVNREEVSWEMRAQIRETLEACRIILDQLGFVKKDE